jgi:hypothetical protein
MTEQDPAKKCTPLRCKTFSKIANSPAELPKPKSTLPPRTVEQIRDVSQIVVNCPYRTKKSGCTNIHETFKGATY